MEEGLTPLQIEMYVLELISGIMPKVLWISATKSGENPFAGYSDEDARKCKRKFRKLKRKCRLNKRHSAASLWRDIDAFLSERER